MYVSGVNNLAKKVMGLKLAPGASFYVLPQSSLEEVTAVLDLLASKSSTVRVTKF